MVLAVLALPVWWLTAPISYGVYVSVSKQRSQPVTYASIFFTTLGWAFFPAFLASRAFPSPTPAELVPACQGPDRRGIKSPSGTSRI